MPTADPDADRQRRALEIYECLLGLAPEQRDRRIVELCGSDAELRALVQRLVEAGDRGGLDLSQAVAHTARELLTGELTALPERIGPYRIVGRLGAGAMGIVYDAEQDFPRRRVALKVLAPGLHTPEAQKRFRFEAELLARLRHPGIARIYEAGVAVTDLGPQPYIAMERIDGPDLRRFVQQQRPGVRQLVGLFAAICDAVAYAHSLGVIHRDLKPSNVLIESTPGGPQPRICDFGVGRLIGDDPQRTLVTASGQLVGTPAYMAPELFEDPHAAGTQCDVYALGVMLYEMLAGRRPIEPQGTSLASLLDSLRRDTPRRLGQLDRRLRGDLETIVHKAITRDPAMRYATAAELAADLRRYLNHEPVTARSPGIWYVLSRAARRHRAAVTAAAAVLVAIVGFGSLATVGFVRARIAQHQLERQLADEARAYSALVNDVASEMKEISGSKPALRALLNITLAKTQRLLEKRPDDPELLDSLAKTLTYLSDIEADIGNLQQALSLRRRALVVRERLIGLEPDNLDVQADTSITLVKIGDIFRTQNRRDEVWPWYLRALEIDQSLHATDPRRRYFADNLFWSYHRLGELANEQQRPHEFLDWEWRAVLQLEALDRIAPDDIRTLHAKMSGHASLALALARNGLDEQALAWARRSVAEARELCARVPSHRKRVIDALLAVYGNVPTLARHDPPAALTLLDWACAVADRVAALEPIDWLGNTVRINLYASRAWTLWELGRREVALDTLAAAGQHYLRWLDQAPQSARRFGGIVSHYRTMLAEWIETCGPQGIEPHLRRLFRLADAMGQRRVTLAWLASLQAALPPPQAAQLRQAADSALAALARLRSGGYSKD